MVNSNYENYTFNYLAVPFFGSATNGQNYPFLRAKEKKGYSQSVNEDFRVKGTATPTNISSLGDTLFHETFGNGLGGDSTAQADSLEYGKRYTITITDSAGCVDAVFFWLMNNIDETQNWGILNLYPNPNNGQFVLSLEKIPSGEYNMVIRNMFGQSMHTKKLLFKEIIQRY